MRWKRVQSEDPWRLVYNIKAHPVAGAALTILGIAGVTGTLRELSGRGRQDSEATCCPERRRTNEHVR